MESKELMVGDFVMYNPERIKGFINAESFAMLLKSGEELEMEGLSPIPLTPEILVKNGFEIRGYANALRHLIYTWQYRKEGKFGFIDVTFYEKPFKIRHLVKIENSSSKGSGFNSVHNCDIDYVHQLQHAIRLCGIEKEIIVP